MQFIHGKNVLLEYGTGDPIEWVPFLCAKSCDITLNVDLLKITDTNNGRFSSSIPVGISGSMTTNGLVKFDDDTFTPINLLLNLTPIRARFVMTEGAVQKVIAANGFLQTANLSGGVFSLTEQNLTIQLSGLIETATLS